MARQREPGRASVIPRLVRNLEKDKWVDCSMCSESAKSRLEHNLVLAFLFILQQDFIKRKKTEICFNHLHDLNVPDLPLKTIKL